MNNRKIVDSKNKINLCKNKKILLIIPTNTSYYTFLDELAHELSVRGWDVHLAASLQQIRGYDCYDSAICGTPHQIDFPRGYSIIRHIQAAIQLNKLVKQIYPSIIHCHFSAAAFTTAIAKQAAWPKVIATIQGSGFAVSSGIYRCIFGLAEIFIAKRMNEVWLLSRSDIDAYYSIGLTGNINLQRSYGFGCQLDKFDRAKIPACDTAKLRKELGIQPDEFVYIFVGRQVYFKGYHITINAFMKIKDTCPKARLILVGDRDPIHKTGLTSDEEDKASRFEKITHVGWQKNVAIYMAIADVNVFPSIREGMPVNLMESLAVGLPVITSNSRGCKDVVRDGVDGIVLKETSVESFAQAMIRFYNNRSLGIRLSEEALAGRSRFDRKIWINEQINIYENQLNLS